GPLGDVGARGVVHQQHGEGAVDRGFARAAAGHGDADVHDLGGGGHGQVVGVDLGAGADVGRGAVGVVHRQGGGADAGLVARAAEEVAVEAGERVQEELDDAREVDRLDVGVGGDRHVLVVPVDLVGGVLIDERAGGDVGVGGVVGLEVIDREGDAALLAVGGR